MTRSSLFAAIAGATALFALTAAPASAQCPAITVTPAALPAGTVGADYNVILVATGGPTPFTFSISTGAVPPGVILDTGGRLSGRPTTAGNSTFTVKATASNGCAGLSNSYTVVINCPTITVSPAALAASTLGANYSVTFNAAGGRTPYSFGLSTGTLPPGLTLDSGGTLSGRPTTVGSFNFTIKASDADGCTGSTSYTLVINPAACPTITVGPAALAASTVGANYSVTFTASGGRTPHAFGISSGAIPPGLALDSGGLMTGRPITAGNYNFIIKASDADGCTGSTTYTLIINPALCPTITVSPAALAASTVGANYSTTFTASGGRAPYSFGVSAGGVPPGLTLASGGTLSGLPTAAGNYNFTVKAADADGCTGSTSYTLVINPQATCPTISIAPDVLAAGTAGMAYRQTFSASGGLAPYSWSANFVPAGLLFEGDTLAGAPLNAGSYTLTIKATAADHCSGSRIYSLIVNPAACPSDKATLSSPANGAQVTLPVALSWTAVNAALGYKVFALVPNATVATQLGATTATSLSVSALPQGQIQWWVVTEFDKCPSSESAHNVFTVAASQTCPTEAPVTESPANGATGVENPVKFSWRAVNGALKYNVYGSLNGGASSLIGSTTGTILTAVVPEGTIDWIVEATFENCPATRSASSRFTTKNIAVCPVNPGSPALTEPVSDAKVVSPVTVRWNAAQGAISYRVHASLNGGAPSVVGTTAATELQIPLPAGVIVIQVEALFAGNCPSTFSQRTTFTVTGGDSCSNAPTTLVAPANGADAQSPVTFSWTAVPRAATYRLFVSSNGSTFELMAETRETTLSRLVPPGSYAWFVDTTFLGCDSVRSATFRFTVSDPKKCPEASITLVSPPSGASVISPATFSWSAVASAISYRLWAAVDGGAPSLIFKGTVTSATISVPSGNIEWYVDAQLPDCPTFVVSPTGKFIVLRASTCDSNQRATLLSPLSGPVTSPVPLRWTGSASAVGHRVWLSLNGAPYADIGITRETSLTTELPDGNWSWYVDSLFENCPPLSSTSKGSFTIAELTPRCATEAPATISPADGATTASPVTLLWTSVLNAAAYRLYASKGGEYFLIGETTDTSLTLPVPPGTYVWFVEAVFKGCSSTTSMKARFTVAAATNCATDRPQTISPRDGDEAVASPVRFAWSPISGSSRYVLIARGENGSPTAIGETTDTSLTVPMPPVTIEWWVIAFRTACDSVESNHSTFTVLAPPACDAKAPVLLSPLDGATETPPTQFAWTSSARARAYKLWVAAGSNPFTLITTTNDTRAFVPIPPGPVSWFVEAVFDDCPPLQSAIGNFTVGQLETSCRTPDAPSISLAGQVLSGTEFTVRWSALGSASAYELQESSSLTDFAGATTTIVSDTVARFTYTASGTPIQKFYRVRAVSACNEERGPYSSVIGVFIVPTNTIETKTRGTMEQGVSNTPIQTLVLPGSPTPINFRARMDRPGWHVAPGDGTIGSQDVTLTISADNDVLGVGANSATAIIDYSVSGKGALTTGNPPPGTVPVSVSLVTPVGQGGKNTPPPDSLIIPAVAHAQGANNSLFQSDVRVANTSTQTMKYLLNFTPSGVDGTVSGSSTQIQIEPGATAALDDILASFFGTGTGGSASGVLEIRPLSATTSSTSLASSGSSLATATVASSRTYNVTSTGTFGQYIPAVAFSKFIGKPTDGTRAILSLQQVAQSAAYRTNLGLVEAAGEPAEVRVTVFDKSNAVVAEIPVSLQAAEHRQLNSFLAANNITLEDGRFEVEVTSDTGRVTAYASTIDNISNDPLLVSPVLKSSVNGTRYVIPGVASIDGLAKWRTDVRLYNTSASAVNATLTFYPQGNAAPQASSITLQPGETRALDNVLRNQFGLTEANVGGSVLVTTQAQSAIVATARTYAETSAGTYGQFIPAVTPDEGVALGGRSLHLIQLEQSAAYRTNVGLVETTGQDVTAEVTLILPDSKLTPKVPITLPANGFLQFPLSAFNVGNAVYNARISIKVTSGRGRVSAYGSVIDNRTSDPTYVPAQ